MLAEFSGVLDLEYPPADGVGGGTKHVLNCMSIFIYEGIAKNIKGLDKKDYLK